MLKDEQIAELGKPLDGRHVKKRSQGGTTLSYLEGWKVIEEANRIFGFDGWHRETVEIRLVGEELDTKSRHKVGYIAKVKITVTGPEDKEDIIREGWGFGNGLNASKCDAHELAVKEAETDAMKRAFMTFGYPFGLALYDKTQEHVENGNGPKNGTERALADGIHPDPDDFLGDENVGKKSQQAINIGNELVKTKDVAALDELVAKHKKTVASLHKVDRDYLNGVVADQRYALRLPEAARTLA